MRFESKLIHRCSLLVPGQQSGTDPYGRPILGTAVRGNIKCRADQIRSLESRDENGTDVIMTNLLFFPPYVELRHEMQVVDVLDTKGNPVLEGTFNIQNIFPSYGRRGLRHFEVVLQRM